MTDKHETSAKINSMGFHAEVESGVVMVEISTKKDVEKVNSALMDMGYECSCGVRVKGSDYLNES